MAESTLEDSLWELEGRVAALQSILVWTISRVATSRIRQAEFIATLRELSMTATERAGLHPSYCAGHDETRELFLHTAMDAWKIDLGS